MAGFSHRNEKRVGRSDFGSILEPGSSPELEAISGQRGVWCLGCRRPPSFPRSSDRWRRRRSTGSGTLLAVLQQKSFWKSFEVVAFSFFDETTRRVGVRNCPTDCCAHLLKAKASTMEVLTGSVASSCHLPEDERDRIHVGLLQGLETGFVDGPVQNFGGHVPHSSLSGVQAFSSIPRLAAKKKCHEFGRSSRRQKQNFRGYLTARPRSQMQHVRSFLTSMFLLFRSRWATHGLAGKRRK